MAGLAAEAGAAEEAALIAHVPAVAHMHLSIPLSKR